MILLGKSGLKLPLSTFWKPKTNESTDIGDNGVIYINDLSNHDSVLVTGYVTVAQQRAMLEHPFQIGASDKMTRSSVDIAYATH